jgi:hypothetical protein
VAALPAMLESAQRAQMPPAIIGFLLPLAASVFRVGAAVAQPVGVLFLARLYGVVLSPAQLASVVFTVVLTSFTIPGIPGGSIIAMVPVLAAVNLPIDGIGILLAVDTIPDMFRTTGNVTGSMTPILDAVKYVHERGTLHRDISPDNIMVDKFGKPVLVDFGAAKLDLRRAPSVSSIIAYRPEYAPVEQREPSVERPEGYYTDIFALAGTMYRLLSGSPPVGSVARSLASKDPYVPVAEVSKVKCSDAVFKAIDRGLALPPKNRPATIEEFAKLLGWRGVTTPTPLVSPPTTRRTVRSASTAARRPWGAAPSRKWRRDS